jgi:hypothetical protein
MDFNAVSIPQGFEDYLVTILWYFDMDDRSVYEFSKTANRKLLDYYSRFYKAIEILDLLDTYLVFYKNNQLGNDFALEQLRTGCGFIEGNLLKKEDRDLFCRIAKCFPKFYVFENENGELEVE